MMKLGCSSWSYHRAFERGDMTQISWIRKCKELGLDGVELLAQGSYFPSIDRSYLRRLKLLCVNEGLTISCVAARNDFGGPKDELAKEVERVKRWVEVACYLGAPVVRVFGTEHYPPVDRERVWEGMIAGFKEVTEYAEENGVMIGLENHGRGLTSSADDVLRAVEEVGSDWFRLTLDFGNFPADTYGSIERTAHLAVHVHAKILDVRDGVERRLDYSRIMPVLRRVNYNGYLSLEYEGDEREETAVPKAVRYLRSLILAR
ncbi:TPA: hypothetical protein EYP44_04395 [Candidatus Bathyarchaeota archaeon]|nr:hypothetical protein [Candidatus Bathyarchaeota archaeon]